MKTYMISSRKSKRGSILLIFAICLLAMMGLAALAVDVGAIYAAKTQLQAGADAAALAGAQTWQDGQAKEVAVEYASFNKVLNRNLTLDSSDVMLGAYDFVSREFTADAAKPNAIRINARRTDDSPDGPIGLFFGKALGFDSVSISTEAIAALDHRVSGVGPASGPGHAPLLPFVVNVKDVGAVKDSEGNFIDQVEFEIDTDSGMIVVYERVDLRVQVLGTEVTYGADGPTVPVYASVSLDGGAQYLEMNRGRAVKGGESSYFTNVDDPSQIVIRGRALHKHGNRTLFDRTLQSSPANPAVLILRAGDFAPDIPAFSGQTPLNEFIAPYLDEDGRVLIGYNDVMFLFEFDPNLESDAADYQDLVVVCTFSKVQEFAEEAFDYSDHTFVAKAGSTITFFPDSEIGAPGNWGTVSLDAVSNSTAVLCYYIENGYDKSFEIPADPGYVYVRGDPGISNGIRPAVESRIGDTVLLLVYDHVGGQGANTYYRVPYFVAVELTAMGLNGSLGDRYIRGIVREVYAGNFLNNTAAPQHASMGKWRMAR